MRSVTAEVLAALTGTILRPAVLVQATFATNTLYLWSGKGTLNWNGFDWQGLGALGSISVIEEGTTVEARGITLTLSGILNSLLADVLQELQLGAPVLVYLALFDETPALIPDPVPAWVGRMDQPTIEVGGDTAKLSINCENRLIDMNVSVDKLYTQDQQQADHPGDVGFQFVNGIQSMTIYWGRTANATNL